MTLSNSAYMITLMVAVRASRTILEVNGRIVDYYCLRYKLGFTI